MKTSRQCQREVFLLRILKRGKFLLELYNLQAIDVNRVEQVSGKRRVVGLKFALDEIIQLRRRNLRIKSHRNWQSDVGEPREHGVAIIGMLGEKFYSAHDFVKLVEAVTERRNPLVHVRCESNLVRVARNGAFTRSDYVGDVWRVKVLFSQAQRLESK